MQVQFEGCRRNCEVYRKIAKELTEAGYTRAMEQFCDKIKKLRAECKKKKKLDSEEMRLARVIIQSEIT